MAAATSVSFHRSVRYDALGSGIQTKTAHQLLAVSELLFPHLYVGSNCEFVIEESCHQTPTIFVIDRERLRSMERRGLRVCGTPDLAIEIVGPNDLAEELIERLNRYLEMGTKTVWAIMARSRAVLIRNANGLGRRAVFNDFVDAPAVMPGVQIPVARLFPEI